MNRFKEPCGALAELLNVKDKEYGSAYQKVAQVLDILYPNGIQPNQYKHAMLVVRILDKVMRISQGAFEDSYRDIAGYGILGLTMIEKREPRPATTRQNLDLLRVGETREESTCLQYCGECALSYPMGSIFYGWKGKCICTICRMKQLC